MSDSDTGPNTSAPATTDATPATTAFDARERLRGAYDHVQFGSGSMADSFDAIPGGEE